MDRVQQAVQSGDVDFALDLAVAPLRLMYRNHIERYDRDSSDQEEGARALVLERVIEDIETIQREMQDLDARIIKRRAKTIARIATELKPDLSEEAVSRVVGDYFIGAPKKQEGGEHETH